MSDQEAYHESHYYYRGLEKLHLAGPALPAVDLRTDPAFAWRVLERLTQQRHEGKPTSVTFNPNYCCTHTYPGGEIVLEGHAAFPAQQLYAAVVALGRSES